MKLNLVRKPWGFLFAEDEDAEKARKIKADTIVTAEVKVLRNLKLHRKFFKLIDVAWNFLTEAQQEFFHNSVDGFRYTLEVAAGYYEEFYSVIRREWIQKPKSIAFDKMDEAEFDKLYEAVLNVVFKFFLEYNRVNRDTFYNAMKDF